MGQGEKLVGVRQPGFPTGGRRKGETCEGLLGERGGREKEQRRGAIKTLTSNLVYCVKKSHMHSRPPEGPRRSPCGRGGHQLLASSPLLRGSAWTCAAAAGAVAAGLQPVCWGPCWRKEGWTGRMTGERTPKRLITKKRT